MHIVGSHMCGPTCLLNKTVTWVPSVHLFSSFFFLHRWGILWSLFLIPQTIAAAAFHHVPRIRMDGLINITRPKSRFIWWSCTVQVHYDWIKLGLLQRAFIHALPLGSNTKNNILKVVVERKQQNPGSKGIHAILLTLLGFLYPKCIE